MSVLRESAVQVENLDLLETVVRELGGELTRATQVTSEDCREDEDGRTVMDVQVWTRTIGNCVASMKLPGWQYPVAVTADGKLHYDNHNGGWGKQEKLDSVLKEYSTRFVLARVPTLGMRVISQNANAKGELVLTIRR